MQYPQDQFVGIAATESDVLIAREEFVVVESANGPIVTVICEFIEDLGEAGFIPTEICDGLNIAANIFCSCQP